MFRMKISRRGANTEDGIEAWPLAVLLNKLDSKWDLVTGSPCKVRSIATYPFAPALLASVWYGHALCATRLEAKLFPE